MKNIKSDLTEKILYTIMILVVYRLGSFITIPCIDISLITEFFQQNQKGFLGMLDVFSGGSISRMSIFALAIYPYITASIIVQLMSFIYPSIKELNKQGEIGKHKINQITKYITVLIAAIQGYSIASYIKFINANNLANVITISQSSVFTSSCVSTLVAGTMILMWLSGRISAKGIGNGSSLIICVGIISSIPQNLLKIFNMSKIGDISIVSLLTVCFILAACMMFIIFMEQSYRKIPIQYPKQHFFAMHQQDKTYLPFKINMAGVIPPIFTNTVLLGPISLLNYASTKSNLLSFITKYLARGSLIFYLLSILCIFFFSFFYVNNAVNLDETSGNLQKNGAYIPGKRPGSQTKEYLKKIVNKLTILGACYLCFICFIPEIFFNYLNVNILASSTSLLIVINVLIDLIEKIQTYNLQNKYGNMMTKKIKIRSRGK